MKTGKHSFIFGPVKSRRLGRSLGIDPLPHKNKTCSFNCIYCEAGPTDNLSCKRELFFEPSEILEHVRTFLKNTGQVVDYLTVTGAGEPALYLALEELVCGLKDIRDRLAPEAHIALITNSSLFTEAEVRKAASLFETVLPTITTLDEKIFRIIHRPHPALALEKILEGLIRFRQEYNGFIEAEIFLIENINDSMDNLSSIKSFLEKFRPDSLMLNTVSRPSRAGDARPLAPEKMKIAEEFFSSMITPQKTYKMSGKSCSQTSLDEDEFRYRILEAVSRRPMPLDEISSMLGLEESRASILLQNMLKTGDIKVEEHTGILYYSVRKLI